MRRLSLGFLMLAAIFGLATAKGNVKPFDVKGLMSADQFRSAGLAKLSHDQMAALNAALSDIPPAADKTIDLRDIMTVNQYHDAGLDTLSAAEISNLNTWLNGRARVANASTLTAVPAASPPVPAPTTGAAAFGASMLAPQLPEPDRIESRILGTFKGWSGKTIFKLENGQVWQQADDSSEFETNIQNPKVIIKKLGWGYLLTIPGDSDTVFVRRIR